MSYRDPQDALSKVVKLNSYLALDNRGHRALSGIKKVVLKNNVNISGKATGRGLLGSRIRGKTVDLSNSQPKDRLEEE